MKTLYAGLVFVWALAGSAVGQDATVDHRINHCGKNWVTFTGFDANVIPSKAEKYTVTVRKKDIQWIKSHDVAVGSIVGMQPGMEWAVTSDWLALVECLD